MEILHTNSIFGIKKVLLSLVIAIASFGAFAGSQETGHGAKIDAHTESTHGEEKKPFDAVTMIMHHISDAHEFHIAGDLTMPLPVILYTEKGLVTFMSSEFQHDDHGHQVVEKKGLKFIKNHEHIYYAASADAHGGHVTLDAEGGITNKAPLDFSITKNVFSMIMSAVLLLIIFISVASAYKKRGVNSAPSGFQNVMETLIVFVRDEILKPNITSSKVDKFLPYLLTVFFFIWINNMIGLIPFYPFSSNLTGNIAFTLTLAVCTMIITNVNGNKNYWGHIFWMPGVPAAMKIVLAPIELIGVFTKPFALMVRLFANITAGHIIILSLISVIFSMGLAWASLSAPLTLFMNVLELLVAFLQAYVFTLLSALFIGQAVDDHH